ncbi:hypothetical protein OIU13_11720 [Brevundimonas sp. BT-123]|uniref:hypothetical protein n=1 Tax=Brevundimonas sp. BT-123 TaxID=2986928 RepID=UPI00223647A3|nr:hypothetical protein [Brevundimonas sp. BT-123]MCW0047197.1 hypothetical protein [Brevundimonas sp. BT-123]
MSVAAAITSVNAALTTLKAMRAIEKAYDQAVLKSQLAELMGNLSEAKMALIDAKEEISARDDEIKDLKGKLKKQAETAQFDGYSYAATVEGKPTGAPYCNACIANDGTQIPLSHAMDRHWLCPRCKGIASNVRKFP